MSNNIREEIPEAVKSEEISARDYIKHEEQSSLHYSIFCFATIILATNLAFDYLTSSSSNVTSFLEYSSIAALTASGIALGYDHYEYQQKQQAAREIPEAEVRALPQNNISYAQAVIERRSQQFGENIAEAQVIDIAPQ